METKMKVVFFCLGMVALSFLFSVQDVGGVTDSASTDGLVVEIFEGELVIPKGFKLINNRIAEHALEREIVIEGEVKIKRIETIQLGINNDNKTIQDMSTHTLNFELINELDNKNFSIKVWSMEEEDIFPSEYYIAIIYSEREYIKIGSGDLNLWKKLVESWAIEERI